MSEGREARLGGLSPKSSCGHLRNLNTVSRLSRKPHMVYWADFFQPVNEISNSILISF